MKITRRQLRDLIKEASDTKLSRARSKGSLPDARPDEKRAARRAERRYGGAEARRQGVDHELKFSEDHSWNSDADTNDPDDVDSQDMADAKRYAKPSTPEGMAKHLGISVEDWHRIRQELDDHYEDRHREDQMEWGDDDEEDRHPLDVNGDGKLTISEMTRKQLRKIIKESIGLLVEEEADCIRDLEREGYTPSEARRQCREWFRQSVHPLDVNGDGELTISERKRSKQKTNEIALTRDQMLKLIQSELDGVEDIESEYLTVQPHHKPMRRRGGG